MQAKMVQMMELLEEKGTDLREPYTKPLGDGIFELRCRQSSNISRALFFFFLGGKIIITQTSQLLNRWFIFSSNLQIKIA